MVLLFLLTAGIETNTMNGTLVEASNVTLNFTSMNSTANDTNAGKCCISQKPDTDLAWSSDVSLALIKKLITLKMFLHSNPED